MREIYSKVAKRMNVSEELVEFVSNHIFAEVRKQIVSPTYPRIIIKNFGSFTWNDRSIKKALSTEGSEYQKKAWEEKRKIWRSILRMKDSSSPNEQLNK